MKKALLMNEEQLRASHEAWFEQERPLVYLQYQIWLQTKLNRSSALTFLASEALWLTDEAYRNSRKTKPRSVRIYI
jgi:hypothetical protein